MNFLVLLLVLWVEKFSAGRLRIQQDGPWLQWLTASSGRSPWFTLALAVLLPVALLGLLVLALEPLAYGWLLLPVHLLVLVYSLGRGDLLADLGPFRDAWRRGDEQAALHVAERDLGLEADAEAELLERVGSQFAAKVDSEAGKLIDIGASVSGSALEVASLGEAFGHAVQLFSESNDKMMAALQRIEGALAKSLTRSDEQLAYYVAQAREIIDLSIMSQKKMVDDLQRVAGSEA